MLMGRSLIGGALAVSLVLLAACTTSNPGYVPEEDQAVTPPPPDSGEPFEGSTADRRRADARPPQPDLKPNRDAIPWPDAVAWQCKTNLQCDDKLACTDDTCTAENKCQNALKAGFCIIGGACVQQGQANAVNPCESCQPAKQTMAWSPVTDGTGCASDGLGCTDDVCKGGFCAHALQPKACLIGGACHQENALNPQQTCQACKPAVDQQAWTPLGDGATCGSDNLTCTDDVCKAGSCTHNLAGGFCLIGNVCRKEGYSASGDPCNECVPLRSKTALTFVAGKPCQAPFSSLIAGMCWQSKCGGWMESFIEPKIVQPGPGKTATALNAVAFVPPASEVWAAGEYTPSTLPTAGMLARLSSGSVTTPPIMAPLRFKGISHRVAVGDGGQAWYHDGLTWAPSAKLQTVLGGVNRGAVWGAQVGPEEVYWITGFEGNGSSGVLRCTLGLTVGCDAQLGIQPYVEIGGIAGTLGAIGLGPVWAVPVNADEDIYYGAPGAKSFSRIGPQGCEDLGTTGSTPCSNTTGDFYDLFASGSSDVWAVGSSGLIMHFDGTKWVKHSSVVSYQGSYTFRAVYSSPSDKLTTLVGHSAWSAGRFVSVFNYNSDLQRWFGPINLVGSNQNPEDEIRDAGGNGYSNLWLVGTRLVGQATGNPRMVGWALQLK